MELGIQSSIEASSAKFTPAMQRVATAIRDTPSLVLNKTIYELAETCQTSVASVVRFCQALGLSGYAQLRMSLATELGKETAQYGGNLILGAEIAKSDTLREMASKVASLEMLAIDETVSGLDYEALERVVADMIHKKAQQIAGDLRGKARIEYIDPEIKSAMEKERSGVRPKQ